MKLKDLTFSLSGMENQVKRLLAEEAPANVALHPGHGVQRGPQATQEAQRRCPGLPVLCSGGGLQPTAAGRHGEELRRPVRPALLPTDNAMGGGPS